MISIVQGRLLEQGQDHIIVVAGGIGYKILVPVRTLADLGPLGSEVTLRTHLVVREDAWTLFGFVDGSEVEMFHLLTAVNGVGPKMALSVLSTHPVHDIAGAVLQEDLKFFTRVPGVGKKTAARLLLELKDKVAGYSLVGLRSPGVAAAPAAPAGEPDKAAEVRMALEALGFQGKEVDAAVTTAIREAPEDADVSKLLKRALAVFRAG